MAVKIQARQLLRFARKNGITPARGSYRTCAEGILAQSLGLHIHAFKATIAVAAGVTRDDILDLETGFEGFRFGSRSSRYYKVGKNLARLAGLPDRNW